VCLVSLTAQESEILADYIRSCFVSTIRLRAHAIIMRSEKFSLEDISKLVFSSTRAITRWFVVFDEKRLVSIFSGLSFKYPGKTSPRRDKEFIRFGSQKKVYQTKKLQTLKKQFARIIYSRTFNYKI